MTTNNADPENFRTKPAVNNNDFVRRMFNQLETTGESILSSGDPVIFVLPIAAFLAIGFSFERELAKCWAWAVKTERTSSAQLVRGPYASERLKVR